MIFIPSHGSKHRQISECHWLTSNDPYAKYFRDKDPAAGVALQKLPALRRRAKRFPGWHLDAAGCHELAGIPSDRVCLPARSSRLHQPDSHISVRPCRRRPCRPVESATAADYNPDPRYASACFRSMTSWTTTTVKHLSRKTTGQTKMSR